MRYIAMGAAAFVLAGLFDLASLNKIPYLKQVAGLAAALLFSYALVMLALNPVAMKLPAVVSYLTWVVAALALLLLIYSLFIEIPFRQTYVEPGAGPRLITTGTYGLVRHPGVLWMGLFLLAFALARGSFLLLLAAPVWLLVDVLYVWAQEKWLLGRLFPEYEQYRAQTPMLVPTRASIVRCWRTMLCRE